MAQGTITALGIGSNVLTSDVLQQLREAEESARVKPFTQKMQTNIDKQTSLTKLTTLLDTLNSSTKKLSDTSTYLSRSTTSSGGGVSMTAGAGLPVQDISVRVNQLAASDINQIGVTYESRDSVFSNINGTLKFNVGGKDYSINIKAGSTLGDVAQSITDETDGAVMGIIMKTGGSKPFQLMINSKETGENNKIYFGTTLLSKNVRAGEIEANGSGDFTVTLKDKNGADKTLDITIPKTEKGSDSQSNAEAIQKAIKDAIAADSDFAGLTDEINVSTGPIGKQILINDRRGHAISVGGSKASEFGFSKTSVDSSAAVEGKKVASGKLAGTLTIGNIDLDLSTLTSAGNTSEQNAEAVRNAINSSTEYHADVENGRLIIRKNNGGSVQVTIKGADKSAEQEASQKAIALLGLNAGTHQSYADFQQSKLKLTNIQSAQDSKFTYNGISISRHTNSITDVVSGVNLELTAVHKDTDSPSVLRVTRDNKAIFDEVKSFVEGFNEFVSQLEIDTKYDTDTKIAGIFNGDSDLRTIKGALNSLISYTDGDRNNLFKFGVTLSEKGRLTLDEEKLKKVFEEDPDAAIGFFKGATKKVAGKDIEVDGIFRKFNISIDKYITGSNSRLKLLETSLVEEGKMLDKKKTQAQKDLESRYDIMAARFAAYDSMIASVNRSFASLNMMIQQANK